MTSQPGRPRVLACPNCGGVVELRAPGSTISAVCRSCGSTIDVATPELRVVAAAQARVEQPLRPLGTRGRLAGGEWEAIGYQRRSTPAEGWRWEEYLLFNPYDGFRFLVHDEDGWVLYAMLRRTVPEGPDGPDAGDGRQYRPLGETIARTDYVMGEFYWRARVGEEIAVAEYESPPILLSRESNADEVTWSRGMRLADAAVRTAFGISAPAAPSMPVTRRAASKSVYAVFAVALLVYLVIAAIPFGRFHDQPVFATTLIGQGPSGGTPVVSDAFTVPGNGGNLAIGLHAALSNSWLDVGLALVDQSNASSLRAARELSFYTGVDSDGPWSEGSQTASVLFRNVPGGVYRLVIDTDSNSFPSRLTLSVRRHVPSEAIFVLALLGLAIYPAWRVLTDFALPAQPKLRK